MQETRQNKIARLLQKELSVIFQPQKVGLAASRTPGDELDLAAAVSDIFLKVLLPPEAGEKADPAVGQSGGDGIWIFLIYFRHCTLHSAAVGTA